MQECVKIPDSDVTPSLESPDLRVYHSHLASSLIAFNDKDRLPYELPELEPRRGADRPPTDPLIIRGSRPLSSAPGRRLVLAKIVALLFNAMLNTVHLIIISHSF